jgi:hypothetical protein
VNTSLPLWRQHVSSVGFGCFMYGKKQKAVAFLFSRLVFMIPPYFVSNPILQVAIGVALMALPYFVRD